MMTGKVVAFLMTAELGVEIPEGSELVLQRKDGTTVPLGPEGVAMDLVRGPGGDLGGPWVSGPKGARFVYLGLPVDGGWSRRWKWRQEQIVAAAEGDPDPVTGTVVVRLFLGKSVTPDPLPSV